MKGKRLNYLILGSIIVALVICLIYSFFPKAPQQPRPQVKIYSYYKIMDAATGKTLMYVSSAPVTKGDALITGDNKRYVVIRVTGNKAYAKYMGTVKLETEE